MRLGGSPRSISGDRAALDAKSEAIGQSQRAMDSSLTTVRQSLADLRGRVHGSGLFVVKEKEQTELPDHGLVLSMTTIRGGRLRSFKIENMHTGQAPGGREGRGGIRDALGAAPNTS